MADTNNFIFNFINSNYAVEAKTENARNYMRYMFARTNQMFKYENLPSTIPADILELYLQSYGRIAVADVNGNLYALNGGFGGMLNEYYIPTQFTVANPYLNFSKNLTIDEDCIIVKNDSLYTGLTPLFSRYANALVENDVTMNVYDIMSRISAVISASDDTTKASAEKYLSDICKGKIGIIGESAFFDGVKLQPNGNSGNSRFTDLIEYEQYLKASWYNELGLNANYNMKRESINSNEAQLNEDALIPLIDDMLKCRQVGVEKINEMFGTDISVGLNSVWLDKQIDFEKNLESSENIGDEQFSQLNSMNNNEEDRNLGIGNISEKNNTEKEISESKNEEEKENA